jgi:hypothetical protein
MRSHTSLMVGKHGTACQSRLMGTSAAGHPAHPPDPAIDARLRPHRFASRPTRLDQRPSHGSRPLRPTRAAGPRCASHQRLDLLVHQDRRFVGSLVFRGREDRCGRPRVPNPTPTGVALFPYNLQSVRKIAERSNTRYRARPGGRNGGRPANGPRLIPLSGERDPPSARRAGDHTSDLHRPRRALVEMAPSRRGPGRGQRTASSGGL